LCSGAAAAPAQGNWLALFCLLNGGWIRGLDNWQLALIGTLNFGRRKG
jgi:hypothetical protein